ncbi:hypothetical protein KC352_g13 [Hortaea werneckii]|nr:hypothetical protein KC352_g13 [Hortaea werneckii]
MRYCSASYTSESPTGSESRDLCIIKCRQHSMARGTETYSFVACTLVNYISSSAKTGHINAAGYCTMWPCTYAFCVFAFQSQETQAPRESRWSAIRNFISKAGGPSTQDRSSARARRYESKGMHASFTLKVGITRFLGCRPTFPLPTFAFAVFGHLCSQLTLYVELALHVSGRWAFRVHVQALSSQ